MGSKCVELHCSWVWNEQVKVGDYDELRIPQEAHRISTGRSASSENLDQVD